MVLFPFVGLWLCDPGLRAETGVAILFEAGAACEPLLSPRRQVALAPRDVSVSDAAAAEGLVAPRVKLAAARRQERRDPAGH